MNISQTLYKQNQQKHVKTQSHGDKPKNSPFLSYYSSPNEKNEERTRVISTYLGTTMNHHEFNIYRPKETSNQI